MDQSTASGASPLNALLSNPEWIERVQSILSSALPSEEAAESANKPPPVQSDAPSVATGGSSGIDGLSGILSNPALLAKLPQLLATVSPMLSSLQPTASTASSKESDPENLPVCREKLLIALKPFLSPKRCQAVDSMLRIAKLGEILGQIK